MQCKCGGATTGQTATHKGVVLDYDRCQDCGMQGNYRLFDVDGVVLDTGPGVLERFRMLKPSAANGVEL